MPIIVAYNGSTSNIPVGWALCDGNNGTPNLVDRFVLGADNMAQIGNVGGSTTHTHTVANGGSHSHSIGDNEGLHTHDPDANASPKWLYSHSDGIFCQTAGHTHTLSAGGDHFHTAGSASLLPPYYKLAFIMETQPRDWDIAPLMIAMFTGSAGNIPEGWTLCDGTNGTVDLRGRFIKGGRAKGETGGSATHTHACAASQGGHTHTLASASTVHTHDRTSGGSIRQCTESYRKGTTEVSNNHSHVTPGIAGTHTHTINEASNDPPYYKLAFIQRIA